MNDNERSMVSLEAVVYIVLLALAAIAVAIPTAYWRGHRAGTCVEMCRPAKFDSDQSVYGGCLCIGSDKVLRIRKEP